MASISAERQVARQPRQLNVLRRIFSGSDYEVESISEFVDVQVVCANLNSQITTLMQSFPETNMGLQRTHCSRARR
jgi:hypothetical protein